MLSFKRLNVPFRGTSVFATPHPHFIHPEPEQFLQFRHGKTVRDGPIFRDVVPALAVHTIAHDQMVQQKLPLGHVANLFFEGVESDHAVDCNLLGLTWGYDTW